MKFNPLSGRFDLVGKSTNDFGTLPIIMQSPDGTRYEVTMADGGTLAINEIVVSGMTGQPMGLLLALTYAN